MEEVTFLLRGDTGGGCEEWAREKRHRGGLFEDPGKRWSGEEVGALFPQKALEISSTGDAELRTSIHTST